MHRAHGNGWRTPRRLGTWALFTLGLGCREAATAPLAPPYAEARAVVERHCTSCHPEHPTIPAFPIAPSGVLLDTSSQMQQYAERIRVRTVLDRTMPLLNKTGMTEDERGVLARWVEHGAKGS